jgi:hypothetical protein
MPISRSVGQLLFARIFVDIRLALYGKPYITAAKDTWRYAVQCLRMSYSNFHRLLQDRGVSAIVNDSLVGMSKRANADDASPILPSQSFNLGRICSRHAFLTLLISILAQ